MKKGMFQKIRIPGAGAPVLFPMSQLDAAQMDSFQFNQPLEISIKGIKKDRSLPQLAWIHVILEYGASILGDRYPDLNTLAKLKFYIKNRIRFFKNEIVIDGVVHVEVRSFGRDDLTDQDEANQVFNDVKNELADLIGCDPSYLDAKAKKDARLRITERAGK